VDVFYDPSRVRDLTTRVLWCIDELRRCRSDDPVAAAALRTIRLTRQNLEDQWMPLLRRIEESTAMIGWTSTGLVALGADPATQRLTELIVQRPWFDDVDAMVHAGVVAREMRALLGDPQACLDVLGNPSALFVLAQWDALPDGVVEAFVSAGLRDAVVQQPGRLADGYEVLRELTGFANGALDDGFRAGMARGVALAMDRYLPALAPGITQTGAYPVYAIDDAAGVDVTLGSYADVTDLFGALLRDEHAQAALGLAVGGYAVSVVNDLGADLTERPGLEHVASITLLVADAASAEQAELIAHAAAQTAFRQAFGDGVAKAVGAGLTATGAGAGTKVLADQAISVLTHFAARVEPGQLPGDPIPSRIYDLITVTTVAMLARRPETRIGNGLDAVSDRDWEAVDDHLEQIAGAATPAERTHSIARLDHWLGTAAPAVASYLSVVRADPGLFALTQPRLATDPDE